MSGSPRDGEFGEVAVDDRWLATFVESPQSIHHGVGASAEVAAALRKVRCVGQSHALGFGESAAFFRKSCPDDVRIDLVVERVEIRRPGAEGALVVLKIAPEAGTSLSWIRRGGRIAMQVRADGATIVTVELPTTVL